MGRRRWSAPRRGSLAFSPRCRASSWISKIKNCPEYEGEPKPLAFVGYKAGMVQTVAMDNKKGSLTFGREIVVPATVVEAPPMRACGIRVYQKTKEGLKSMTEVWMENLPKDLGRLIILPEKTKTADKIKEIKSKVDEISEVRVIFVTQPRQAEGGCKKPELIEVKVGGGSINEQLEYAEKILGKEVKASEIFQEGQWLDVTSVTKGKGFQGPVKRWGVARLPHKSRKTVRGVGSIGPWTPNFVMRTVPRAGQMGFHRRTEYNKQVLSVGDDGVNVTPKGGFVKYGIIKGGYMLLKGSIPGSKKRVITMRHGARPPSSHELFYKIMEINLESQQGK
jgi:large subunit ribosomal protein L3